MKKLNNIKRKIYKICSGFIGIELYVMLLKLIIVYD